MSGFPTPVVISEARRKKPGWGALFVGLLACSVAGFAFAPWSLQDTSVAVLHGLCSQRPSHSFWFGDWRLPFDARMTGIYGGFIVSQLFLLFRGRFRATALPPLSIVVTLALFVVAMGLDGLNSTLDDVGLITIYQPLNEMRYITGALTGTALGVFLWLLSGSILWRRDRQVNQPIIRGWRELLVLLGLVAGFGLIAASGWTALYGPLVFILAASAVIVLFTLSLSFIQLTRRRENSAVVAADLGGPAVVALVSSYAVMLILGGGRFWLEAAMNLPAQV